MFPYAPISNIVPWTQSIAGLNQSIFGTNWTANDATDVLVYSRAPNVPANDILQLVPTNQYTVQFIGSNNIVQVTFGLSFIPTQYNIITIVRATPAQFINLYTNTNFTPSMLNGDFETLTQVDQQNQLFWQQIVPRYNTSATVNVPIDTILPVLGANEFWIKNSTNTAFVAATLGSGGGEFPVLGPFVLYTANSNYPNGFNLGALGSGFLAQTTSLGISTPSVIPFPITVPEGGTGNTSAAPFALVVGGATSTSPLQFISNLGAPGQVFTSMGAGQPGSFQSIPFGTVISSQIPSGTPVTVTAPNVSQNLTSITLTPGNWIIYGNITFTNNALSITALIAGISATSNVMPDLSLQCVAIGGATNSLSVLAPSYNVVVNTTTTYYLVGFVSYGTGPTTMCGNFYAVQTAPL